MDMTGLDRWKHERLCWWRVHQGKRHVGGQWETEGTLLKTIKAANAILEETRVNLWAIHVCDVFQAEALQQQNLDFKIDVGDVWEVGRFRL